MALLSSEEINHRLRTEPDFVNARRHGNSLERVLSKHPDGVPASIVATALNLTEAQVELLYLDVVDKLRVAMKVQPPEE